MQLKEPEKERIIITETKLFDLQQYAVKFDKHENGSKKSFVCYPCYVRFPGTYF